MNAFFPGTVMPQYKTQMVSPLVFYPQVSKPVILTPTQIPAPPSPIPLYGLAIPENKTTLPPGPQVLYGIALPDSSQNSAKIPEKIFPD